jgi:hypothetical protein
LQSTLEALAALPERVLDDHGASRSRDRRIFARLRRIEEGQRVDIDDERDELGKLPTVSCRRRVSEQALLAARIERCVSAGSIKRGAAARNAEPLADASDPAVLAIRCVKTDISTLYRSISMRYPANGNRYMGFR